MQAPDRQSAIDRITIGYAAVKSTAAIYMALPMCGSDNATKLCSDEAVSLQIKKALAVADTLVEEAKAQLRIASDASQVEKWTAMATSAVAAFAQVLATYGVK